MYEAEQRVAKGQRQPEMQPLLEKMEKSIAVLENLVGALSERLSGVTQSEPPQTIDKPIGEIERALPPVLQAISESNKRLRHLNDRVESMLARLEL